MRTGAILLCNEIIEEEKVKEDTQEEVEIEERSKRAKEIEIRKIGLRQRWKREKKEKKEKKEEVEIDEGKFKPLVMLNHGKQIVKELFFNPMIL
jgi:hypothetical protein